jgi:hypothetical protein
MKKPGTFVLTLDTELAWGCMDIGGLEIFREDYERTREVIDRLLEILVRYRIGATWAFVGHLFLDRCALVNGVKHPEIIRPKYPWWDQDWFHFDPATDVDTDPIWYGADIVKKVLSCPVPQEIACHSFSHVIFGDPGCSRESARSEVRRCVELAGELGIRLESFVFPRNKVGHPDVLAEFGFTCFRGEDPCWYASLPGPLRRLGHIVDQFLAVEPPVVEPVLDPSGLVNLPGSQIYLPAHGFRRLLPVGCRVRKAIKGLTRAGREGKVFHLWFHPFNLSRRTAALLGGLETIFAKTVELRSEGIVQTKTMAEAASILLEEGSN